MAKKDIIDRYSEEEYQRQYYQANKEELRKKHKQWYQDNKEKLAEKKRQYYQANKEDMLERAKQYHQSNKEKIAERRKRYYQENKEKFAERAKLHYQYNKEKCAQYYQTQYGRASNLCGAYRRNDKKYNRGECTLTPDYIVEHIFPNGCLYCGEKDYTKLGCDRVDNDLPHTPDNVVCCCADCNNKRQKKGFDVFLNMAWRKRFGN